MFSCEFSEMFEHAPFKEHLWETASVVDFDFWNYEWLRKCFTKTMEVVGEVWGFIALCKTDNGKDFIKRRKFTLLKSFPCFLLVLIKYFIILAICKFCQWKLCFENIYLNVCKIFQSSHFTEHFWTTVFFLTSNWLSNIFFFEPSNTRQYFHEIRNISCWKLENDIYLHAKWTQTDWSYDIEIALKISLIIVLFYMPSIFVEFDPLSLTIKILEQQRWCLCVLGNKFHYTRTLTQCFYCYLVLNTLDTFTKHTIYLLNTQIY